MTAADAEAAADIICSLRAADLAGWTPPWCRPPPACDGVKEEELAWPAVARGKRSRSRRRSPSGSGSSATKGRLARGSPASPLDYSGGSGSGASTSGGEDGAFCSPPAAVHGHAEPTPTPAAATKVGSAGRRSSILPVPPPRSAGQRPRKKMRLPEIQQLVRSLTVENDGLREEMKALQRACTALSKENGKLEASSSSALRRLGMSLTLLVTARNPAAPSSTPRQGWDSRVSEAGSNPRSNKESHSLISERPSRTLKTASSSPISTFQCRTSLMDQQLLDGSRLYSGVANLIN